MVTVTTPILRTDQAGLNNHKGLGGVMITWTSKILRTDQAGLPNCQRLGQFHGYSDYSKILRTDKAELTTHQRLMVGFTLGPTSKTLRCDQLDLRDYKNLHCNQLTIWWAIKKNSVTRLQEIDYQPKLMDRHFKHCIQQLEIKTVHRKVFWPRQEPPSSTTRLLTPYFFYFFSQSGQQRKVPKDLWWNEEQKSQVTRSYKIWPFSWLSSHSDSATSQSKAMHSQCYHWAKDTLTLLTFIDKDTLTLTCTDTLTGTFTDKDTLTLTDKDTLTQTFVALRFKPGFTWSAGNGIHVQLKYDDRTRWEWAGKKWKAIS